MNIAIVKPLKNFIHGHNPCKEVYKKEVDRRRQVGTVRLCSDYCGYPRAHKTCRCWACRGLRWKLFTEDQLHGKGSLYGKIIQL